MTPTIADLIQPVTLLAKQAGAAILAVYRQEHPVVLHKSDHTPVTEADLVAHQLLVEGLAQLTPQFPILSEEGAGIDYAERQTWSTYWLVDPLDGTKEFIARNGEFTVNVALIHQQQPVLGVIYAPVFDECYFSVRGKPAYKQQQQQLPQVVHTTPWTGQTLRVMGSRRHNAERLTQVLTAFPAVEIIPMGSSLKSCRVAEGAADLYLRMGPTSEWDTAAAQCIVEAAGGQVVDVHGQPLRYNTKASLLNPWFLVCQAANQYLSQLKL